MTSFLRLWSARIVLDQLYRPAIGLSEARLVQAIDSRERHKRED